MTSEPELELTKEVSTHQYSKADGWETRHGYRERGRQEGRQAGRKGGRQEGEEREGIATHLDCNLTILLSTATKVWIL